MTKVTLRMKAISGGRQTLYLDYYPPVPHRQTGVRTRREFLGLYLIDETEHEEQTYTTAKGNLQKKIVPVLNKNGEHVKSKITAADKEYNRQTSLLALSIKSLRQLDVNQGRYGFLSTEKQTTDFIKYFEKLAGKRSGSNADNWFSALYCLKDFTRGALEQAKDLNQSFCNDFRKYLLTAPSRKSSKSRLSQNTAVSYFGKFKATLRQAYKDGLLEIDLNKNIDTIKGAETERQYLTLEELQALAQTHCDIPVLKRATIFSALTGLRFSDIHKLVWKEVQHSAQEGYYLRYRQKKTGGIETLPISGQAAGLLGERGGEDELVFTGLAYTYTQNGLPKWLKSAGITKDITFHSFRHTYATRQISLGTDLYTVSKMLGHREIKTTQVYAKIIDKQKREAADRIKLVL